LPAGHFFAALMLLVFENLGLLDSTQVDELLADCDVLGRKITNFSPVVYNITAFRLVFAHPLTTLPVALSCGSAATSVPSNIVI